MDNARAAETADRLLAGRALVFGSPPPAGRDLDLLVRGDGSRLAARLVDEGFCRRGSEYARFRDGRVDLIELVPAESWELPAPELARLFDDAVPIDGFAHLVRPSPADDLLVLARRVPGWTELDERRRARVAAALAVDERAWQTAAGRAAAWGLTRELEQLRAAYETGAPIRTRRRGMAGAVRDRVGRDRGAVIALSGLDGSGKSTHAEALAATLRELGEEAVVEWSRIAFDDSLAVVARPAKAVLRLFTRAAPPDADVGEEYWPDRSQEPVEVTARSLRSRNRIVHAVWTTVVAVTNALAQRRSTTKHLRRGRLVVRDRYVLDSVAHLEEDYGRVHGVGFQARVVRWLSPTPIVAFWLDVSAEEAHRRKPEDFDVPKLAQRRELYRRLHERLGVVRVDTEAPADEVRAALAAEVWRRLG